MAARQKTREIEMCNEEWERRKLKIKEDIARASQERHKESNRIELLQEKIEKLSELLRESSGHIGRLKVDQSQMLKERESRHE